MKGRFECYGWAGASLLFSVLALTNYFLGKASVEQKGYEFTAFYYSVAALVTLILFLVCRRRHAANAEASRQSFENIESLDHGDAGPEPVSPKIIFSRMAVGVAVPLALVGVFVIRSPHVMALAAILLGVAWWLKRSSKR